MTPEQKAAFDAHNKRKYVEIGLDASSLDFLVGWRAGAEMSEWQTIETVPTDGTRVLLAWSDGEVEVSDDPKFFMEIDDDRPTHWMPLPAPPKPEEQAK
jgi:Protein of unknown function (DUF551).